MPRAIEQFEALQQIDPDDLVAHYNLSILYRRMGRTKEAADQQAMFVDKKVDPGRRPIRSTSSAYIPRFPTRVFPGTCIRTCTTERRGNREWKVGSPASFDLCARSDRLWRCAL